MKSRLPEYKSQSLMGPVGIARKTLPTQSLVDQSKPLRYTNKDNTDIRKTFRKFAKA